jgi:hypothetical protein
VTPQRRQADELLLQPAPFAVNNAGPVLLIERERVGDAFQKRVSVLDRDCSMRRNGSTRLATYLDATKSAFSALRLLARQLP